MFKQAQVTLIAKTFARSWMDITNTTDPEALHQRRHALDIAIHNMGTMLDNASVYNSFSREVFIRDCYGTNG